MSGLTAGTNYYYAFTASYTGAPSGAPLYQSANYNAMPVGNFSIDYAIPYTHWQMKINLGTTYVAGASSFQIVYGPVVPGAGGGTAIHDPLGNPLALDSNGNLYLDLSDLNQNYYGTVYNFTVIGTNSSGCSNTQTVLTQSPNVLGVHVDSSCYLSRTTSDMYCWGNNYYNQLAPGGVSGTGNQPYPVQMTTTKDVVGVAPGPETTCYVNVEGLVNCAGNSQDGLLGEGGTAGSLTWVNVFSQSTGTALQKAFWTGLGAYHGCALTTMPLNLLCWGSNLFYQLTTTATFGSNENEATPVAGSGSITDLTFITAATGYEHSCALISSISPGGTNIVCWGNNANGQVGVPTTSSTSGTLNLIADQTGTVITDFVMVGAGGHHSCGVRSGAQNGVTPYSVWCWGEYTSNQYAFSSGNVYQATLVNGAENVVSLSVGADGTCVIELGGTLWCWGYNSDNQLGFSAAVAGTTTPGQVVGPSGTGYTYLSDYSPVVALFSSIMVGGSCAMLQNNSVWCWGDNGDALLGNINAVSLSATPAAASQTPTISVTATNSVSLGTTPSNTPSQTLSSTSAFTPSSSPSKNYDPSDPATQYIPNQVYIPIY
jgi:alpha-tubulin suppressor-like RCC1 family protein